MSALCLGQIREDIVECRNRGEGQDEKRALADRIVQLLLAANLAVTDVILHARVAIHPDNRDGIGVDPHDVHSLLGRICRDGFSHEELGVRWCFEKCREGSRAQKQQEFNEKLAHCSDETIPVPQWADVDVLAVASTHTITAINAVLAGSKSNDDDLCGAGSRLSQDKIISMFPAMKKAFESGLTWVKIRDSVSQSIPELPSFLSDAANKSHGVHRVATQMQCLLKLHQAAKRNQAVSGDPVWARVARDFELRHPEWSGAGKDLCAFVDAWSGGELPTLLLDVDAFNKMLRVKRSMPNKMLGALAGVNLATSPEYIGACLKAMMSAPEGLHMNGTSTVIREPEVQQMKSTKHSECVDAAERMRQAKRWTSQAKGAVDAAILAKCQNELEVFFV